MSVVVIEHPMPCRVIVIRIGAVVEPTHFAPQRKLGTIRRDGEGSGNVIRQQITGGVPLAVSLDYRRA
jgi:hypothetical protein